MASTAIQLPMLTADEYFASPGWSQSAITLFRKRRRRCHAQYVLRTVAGEDAEYFDKGHITHAALLEPHRVNELYRVFPPELLSGKNQAIQSDAAKKWEADCRAEGIIPVKQKTLDVVMAMVNAVLESDIREWLEMPSRREQALFWTDLQTGLPCKLRADILFDLPQEMLCLDIKTCGDASPDAFHASCKRCGYHMQATHYEEGIRQVFDKPCRFLFAAVEDEWPHAVAVHEIDEDTARETRAIHRRTLDEISECVRSGDWSEPWEHPINKIQLRPWEM